MEVDMLADMVMDKVADKVAYMVADEKRKKKRTWKKEDEKKGTQFGEGGMQKKRRRKGTQFGERVGHAVWLIGPKRFRHIAYPTCVSSKLSILGPDSRWFLSEFKMSIFGDFGGPFFGFLADVFVTVTLRQKLEKADPNYFVA